MNQQESYKETRFKDDDQKIEGQNFEDLKVEIIKC